MSTSPESLHILGVQCPCMLYEDNSATGLMDSNKVESFRTRGHAKHGEFDKGKPTFLFFKLVEINFNLHNNNYQILCEVWCKYCKS